MIFIGMKALKIGLSALFLFIGFIFLFMVYMGSFKSINVSETVFEGREIIFTTHKGSYKELKTTWVSFEKDFKSLGLEKCQGLGVYLDNAETPPSELRSILACDLKTVSETVKASLKTKFSSIVLPEKKAFKSEFPYRNELSFFLGAMKVFPKLEKELKAKSLQPLLAIESYQLEGKDKKIDFFFPMELEKAEVSALFEAF